ncbi:DHA1 family bicyclomycin/chloramphenicol resistance-like MFS transporter [Actinocorallia herbida]|uniref:DHA1 family bicyclomycin/chloramphenicol resistance-like MFS transporter n=1 Tax=Actinocorallia herbida TaxID=58109 RepID=A0A3N1D6Q9_9ACTN|nr:multidrug effflux MFS transporter [Actinocorallia herbida]ROO89149.1 DHA1 family bicyclomycin/chloramphenicol resistance-like MFS transporter [Actinocorallia herbida]
MTSPPSPSAPPAAPPAGDRPRLALILALGSLSALGPLSMDLYLPGFPQIAERLDTSGGLVQLTLTTCLIGLAAGQLVAGPLSDAFGRKRPLVIGMTAYLLATLACALAPSVEALIGARLVQGLAGAAGLVIARAIVRDMFQGLAAARFFSTLMLVSALAPVIAPVLGGVILEFTVWRGVFVVLAAFGAVMLAGCVLVIPETLPRDRRVTGGLGASLHAGWALLRRPAFTGYMLTGALGFAAVFCYIGGSSLVLQDAYGVSPTTFSLLFGLNAIGLAVAGQINGKLLLGRFRAHTVLGGGLTALTLSAAGLIAASQTGAPLPWVAALLFCCTSSMGLILPTTTTLALDRAGTAAGTASAFLGAAQFGTAGVSPVLTGLGDTSSALPMSLAMLALSLLAHLAFLSFLRPWRRLPDPLLAR